MPRSERRRRNRHKNQIFTASCESLERRELMSADASFSWEMQETFGQDADADGRTDMWHDPDIIRSKNGFVVNFDASLSKVAKLPQGVKPSYTWRITSADTGLVTSAIGEQTSVRLQEGEYFVRLTVDGRHATGNANDIDDANQKIRIRNILVLSMGDSFGSGEGNPEISYGDGDAVWADEFDGPIGVKDEAGNNTEDGPRSGAHRSSKSASAVAALELERADPHTSVTYVSVAWTGATISGDFKNGKTHNVIHDRCNSGDRVFSQLDEAMQLIGDRRIDALTLSIGGNDIGFSDKVQKLLLQDPLHPLESIDVAEFDLEMTRSLSTLSTNYRELHKRFEEAWVKNGQLDQNDVFLVEYADPTRDADQGTSPILDDVIEGLEIDSVEVEFARDHVFEPLKETMKRAAPGGASWNYVGGIADAFAGHGYSADDPYDSNTKSARARWFRTASESREMQGPDVESDGIGAAIGTLAWVVGGPPAGIIAGMGAEQGAQAAEKALTIGTLHPNELGHKKMGELILGRLRPAIAQLPASSSTTVPTRAPYVSQLTPESGGFELQFSQEIDVESLRSSIQIEDPGRTPIDWSLTESSAGRFRDYVRFEFNQATPLGYRVLITPSVVDGFGYQLDQNRDGAGGKEGDFYSWEDFTGPHGEAYALPEYANVRIRFSEPIDPYSLKIGNLTVTDANHRPVGDVRVTAVTPVHGTANHEFNVELTEFPRGGFELIVDDRVRDMAGIALDHDQDGNPDGWRINHPDNQPARWLNVGIAQESRVRIGGGTALVVVSADEPVFDFDLRRYARLQHTDGRATNFASVSDLGIDPIHGGRNFLLEFAVPDVGDYRLTLQPGIRDWF